MIKVTPRSTIYRIVNVLVITSLLLTIPSNSYGINDIVNKTVVTPDHPGTVSFDPTTIKDIKVADPGANIALIDPPQGNSVGDARLSFPIDIPPGRNGMQPDLYLTYNSSSGNGWLGMGWDLFIPSITVETRWGVPRYGKIPGSDELWETETYLLNGEMLTPVAHRSELIAHTGALTKTFHTRVEGQFRKIVRHGNHPTNYWWEVVNKDGVRAFYGAGPDTGGPTEHSTLVDEGSNIFKWALREVRDLNGNSVKYKHERICHFGVKNGIVPGYQLYITNINYTGINDALGAYNVDFIRDTKNDDCDSETETDHRPDIIIDARGGFKMVTADLLKRIEVSINGEQIRAYALNYATGAFEKTLLQSITQFGENDEFFHTHTFSYYDELRDQNSDYQGFDAQKTWQTYTDTVKAAFDDVGLDAFGQASALSGSIGNSRGGHLYLGFNPFSRSKQGSGGGKGGYNQSDNEGVLALIDLNGDNLPDKVYRGEAGFYFRLNKSGPNGAPEFDESLPLPTLHAISRESSTMTSLGAEIYAIAQGLYNDANTFTTSSTYFSDVNGDGLPDLVENGQVLFNYLSQDGIPTFTRESSSTPNPIVNGVVDTTDIVENYQAVYDQMIDTFPLQDTVTRWTAPFDGQVRISGTVALSETTTTTRINYLAADGVRVAIQFEDRELWAREIISDDYSLHTPTDVDSIDVRRGQHIYFRVQSIFDGAYDQVKWDPEITYLNILETSDVNLVNINRYKLSEDFLLAGRRGISTKVPLTGTVQISGTLQKLGQTTDDVKLIVSKYKTNQYTGVLVDEIELFSRTLRWDEQGDIILDLPINVVAGIDGEWIRLHVTSDSPIDLTKLRWQAELFYTAYEDPAQPVTNDKGEYVTHLKNIPFDVDVFSPSQDWRTPQPHWTTSLTTTIRITPRLDLDLGPGIPSLFSDERLNGTVVFTVKKPGVLLAKQEIKIIDGVVHSTSHELEVAANEKLYFDFSFDNLIFRLENQRLLKQRNIDQIINASATVTHDSPIPDSVPVARHVRMMPNLFGQPYRGWAYAGYNGNRERATKPIDPDDFNWSYTDKNLPFSFDRNQKPTTENLEDVGEFFKSTKAYPFAPLPADSLWVSSDESRPADGAWRGTDELGWVKAGMMSSSRFGLDAISVPRPGDFQNAQHPLSTVNRLSRTKQEAFGAGVPYFSGAYSIGQSYSVVDFLDLNGDQYPDVVANGRIQYTSALGALEAINRPVDALAPIGASVPAAVRLSNNMAWNAGVGGTPPHAAANARGVVATTGTSSPKSNKTGNQMVPLGLGAGIGAGDADTKYDLLDINGDGLPDRVFMDGTQLMVCFNLGYTFTKPEPWGEGLINDGETESGNVNVSSFNDGIYGFAGGFSVTKSRSETEQTLLDINGDGLLDRIKPIGDEIQVAFNVGNGFGQEVTLAGAPKGDCESPLLLDPRAFISSTLDIDVPGVKWDEVRICDDSTDLGASVGVYFTVGIGPLCFVACYLIINPGADINQNMARQEATFRDVDGDGYPDHVASDDHTSMSVARNRTGRTNLLMSVQRPLSASFTISYTRSGNTYDLPQSRWVMSQVTLRDGFEGDGVDQQITSYQYENGYYDRQEREFYGYATVQETHHRLDENEVDRGNFRLIRREYHNRSYYTKGFFRYEALIDGNGNLYNVTENNYAAAEVVGAPTDWTLSPGLDLQGTKPLTETIFPQLVQVDQRFYEGQTQFGNHAAAFNKSTTENYDYDRYGNIVYYQDSGDNQNAGDELSVEIGYSHLSTDNACTANYVTGLPTVIDVFGDSAQMRHRESVVNCNTAQVVRVCEYVANAPPGSNACSQYNDQATVTNGTAAVTDLAYFPNGNLQRVTDPPNNQGERFLVEYEYDSVVQTYVTTATVPLTGFHHVSTADYDFKYGTVTLSTDINGNQLVYAYDTFGRTFIITGPYERSLGIPTLFFEYHPEATVPYAVTRHADPDRDRNDTIDTVLFADGLKRVIQTKKDATVAQASGPPVDMMVASGRVIFDHAGRTVEQYYPVEDPAAQHDTFISAFDTIPPTVTIYDVLDRVKSVTIPNGSTTQMSFGFGQDRMRVTQFLTQVIDAEGRPKESYTDARGLITSIKEFYDLPDSRIPDASTPVLWTSYRYDPLHQITGVMDAKGNVTTAHYDNLGRRTAIDSPDAGLVETQYDLASNVAFKITPKTRALGTSIQYIYDYNRLKQIDYPDNRLNIDVEYTYGQPSDPNAKTNNQIGRIAFVDYQAGHEERYYGPLGELTKQVKTVTFDVDKDDLSYEESYTTSYRYESWGRLLEMVYPDGERLTYKYDAGGLVNYAIGRQHSISTHYIERLEYDKFGQRVEMQMGNGIVTHYNYDVVRRLDQLQAGKTLDQAGRFQNLKYSYDRVDNVTALQNQVAISGLSDAGAYSPQPIPHVGPSQQNFAYDDLYRLTGATGSYQVLGDAAASRQKFNNYQMQLSYDQLHNIQSKQVLNGWHDSAITTFGINVAYQNPITNKSYDLGRDADGDGDIEGGYQYCEPTVTDCDAPIHSPTVIGEIRGSAIISRTYQHDANGNVQQWEQGGTLYAYTWDDDNRLQQLNVDDPSRKSTSTYEYDDAGERVVQFVDRPNDPDTRLVYVNQFYTQRSENSGEADADVTQGSKHIFIGTTRLTTKVLNKQATDNNNLFFFHPNHLGSTHYVTDGAGEIHQHFEDFPFGGEWLAETRGATDFNQTPYRFTGKELDEDTGLYYFGARYYDPKTSIWQSPDPALDKYIPALMKDTTADEDKLESGLPRPSRDETKLPGGGGIYNPINLNLYHYASHNPVKYIDPNGQWFGIDDAFTGPVDEIIVLGGLTIAAALGSTMARDARDRILDSIDTISDRISRSRPKEEIFLVRVQVQGTELHQELHVPIMKKVPVKAAEAIAALRGIQSNLSKSDRRLTDIAFTKAETWINRVAATGGIGPIGSKTFNNPGVNPKEARVDVEVLRGTVNLVP